MSDTPNVGGDATRSDACRCHRGENCSARRNFADFGKSSGSHRHLRPKLRAVRGGGWRSHEARSAGRNWLAQRRTQRPECKRGIGCGTEPRGSCGRSLRKGFGRSQVWPIAWRKSGTSGMSSFVNDSKATNADAAERALSSFSNIYWIAGGKPKAGGIESLVPYLPRIQEGLSDRRGCRRVFETCWRRASPATDRYGWTGRWPMPRLMRCPRPVIEAVVLLSPACASFDQFPNFEVRGDAFRVLVDALPEAPAKDRAA